MSSINSVGSATRSAKASTPQTRTHHIKKRSLTSEAAEDTAAIEMDLTVSDSLSPAVIVSEPASLVEQPMSALCPSSPQRPSTRFSPRAPNQLPALPAPPAHFFAGGREFCRNLPTVIRLTPAILQGRTEFVQTGIKLELVISNLQRSLTRGLEECVNERAAGCRARAGFTIERIKLYIQGADVVLFGKLGTEYDLRALHSVFCDIAAGSDLRYCPNTFPDLVTAISLATPWFNQGASAFILVFTSSNINCVSCCSFQRSMC